MTSPALATLLAVALLAGCAGVDRSPPPTIAPQATLQAVKDPAPAGPGEVAQRQAAIKVTPDWWTLLSSPAIDRTVELALANNWSLEIARANLAHASAGLAAARGGLAPQIDATAEVGRKQYGAFFLGPEAQTFPTFSSYSGGLSAAYDLDLFGAKRLGVERAAAVQAVQAEGVKAGRLSIARDTVLRAVDIAAARAQLDLVDALTASDRRTLEIVRAARRAGAASEFDLTAAQGQLDRDAARAPILRRQLAAARDTLPVLLGKAAAGWTAPDFDLQAMTLPLDLPAALPSELLRDRPDIRAADARLKAASAAAGIASANLYPHFVLRADLAAEGLFSAGATGAAWSLIGGVTAPVFHGGTLTAEKRAAEAGYRAAVADYQETVLAGFSQVVAVLHALDNDAAAVRAEKAALDSADKALDLSRRGYAVGEVSIVQVLDAQRQAALAQFGLVSARAQRYVDTVRLFVAVGGGVEDGRA